MKILFIEIETEIKWAHASVGPAYLSAYIRTSGHQASLLRIKATQTVRDVIPDILKEAPDLIGFSITTRQWKKAAAIAGVIQNTLKIPTIAGGLHATFAPESTLGSGSFDFLCLGEGEGAVNDLLTALEAGKSILGREIPNIWIKNETRPSIRPPLPLLDDLPFTDRDMLDELEGVAHISTMRGCPFPCTYCAGGAIDTLYKGRQYIRRRSVDNVVGELLTVRKNGPLHYVIFLDDTFTFNQQWVENFCIVFGREIGTGFSIHARAETLNQNLIRLLAETGCRSIIIGVESGSRRVREDILKRPGPDQKFIDVFNWIRQAGMLAMASYMIGIPGESAGDIEKTLRLHRKLEPDDFSCFVFYPHPGTPLSRACLQKGYLPDGYLDQPVDYSRTVLDLPGLSGADIAGYYAEFTRLRSKIYRDRCG